MLNNRVIVVTGGAGLLGELFCEGIIMNDGIAIIADLNEKRGNAIAANLNKAYGPNRSTFIFLDITKKESISDLLAKVIHQYTRVDALVNNAYPRNKNYGRHFFDVDYKDFCENLNMHLGGYFLMCQQFAHYFKLQGQGTIINMSSVYGVIAPRFEIYDGTLMTTPVEYSAIKSAIIHLTKYLAKYLKGSNIRVNAISPGGIYDEQPVSFLNAYKTYSLNKGMLEKKDIVGTLLFLLSEDAKYVNGQNIIVDDGFSL